MSKGRSLPDGHAPNAHTLLSGVKEGVNDMGSVKQEFYVIVERDQDGRYVGEVPQLRACYSQGQTLDELMTNIREVIELCLEEKDDEPSLEFVGLERVVV